MKTILINLLKKKITDGKKLRKEYKVRDLNFHRISGKIKAYTEILELLKEEKDGSTERI